MENSSMVKAILPEKPGLTPNTQMTLEKTSVTPVSGDLTHRSIHGGKAPMSIKCFFKTP